ncbi:OmpA family protein [Vaginella massiliensis]|uniref:OmpA family protein n=1 Tax=Vaginella massiliensis TaxID=1816680 RepID=UPI000838E6F1|nr:OmpA family protein [Vaginella massiliensis]
MKKTCLCLLSLAAISSCVPLKKYNDLEDRYYLLLQEKNNFQTQMNDLENALLQKDNELAQLNQELQNKQAELDELQNAFEALAQDSSKDLQDNIDKNRDLLDQLATTRSELTAKEAELSAKINQINELENLLAQQRKAIASLKNSIDDALRGFDGKGITVYEKNGQIYVSMENKLLFSSGKWDVREEAKTALSQLANVLKKQSDLNILIEGHTDSVPYNTKQGEVLDNWDLSVMRATAVTKTLENYNVRPTQMTAAGRSKYIPIGDNSTESGKAKNRRVEIIITPNLEKINKILNQL